MKLIIIYYYAHHQYLFVTLLIISIVIVFVKEIVKGFNCLSSVVIKFVLLVTAALNSCFLTLLIWCLLSHLSVSYYHYCHYCWCPFGAQLLGTVCSWVLINISSWWPLCSFQLFPSTICNTYLPHYKVRILLNRLYDFYYALPCTIIIVVNSVC